MSQRGLSIFAEFSRNLGGMGMAGGLSVRWSAFATITVLLSTLAVFGAAAPASAAGEGTIFSLVNQSRADAGLGPLKLYSSISSVSAAWAQQMADNGAMTHNPNYSSQIPSGWTRAAENVAQGWPSPEAVHNAWMNSPGHRANILGDYTDIGISFLTIDGTTWAVENFAKYGASVPAPAKPASESVPPAPAPAPAPAKAPAPQAKSTPQAAPASRARATPSSPASSPTATALPSPSPASAVANPDGTPPLSSQGATSAGAPQLIPLAAFSDIRTGWESLLRIVVAVLLTLTAAAVARSTVLSRRRRAARRAHS